MKVSSLDLNTAVGCVMASCARGRTPFTRCLLLGRLRGERETKNARLCTRAGLNLPLCAFLLLMGAGAGLARALDVYYIAEGDGALARRAVLHVYWNPR